MLTNYLMFNGFLDHGYTASMEVNIMRFSVGNMDNPSIIIYGITVACEALSILMVLGFVMFWKVKTKQTSNWLESQIPEPCRYAISINGFPINEDGTVDMDS